MRRTCQATVGKLQEFLMKCSEYWNGLHSTSEALVIRKFESVIAQLEAVGNNFRCETPHAFLFPQFPFKKYIFVVQPIFWELTNDQNSLKLNHWGLGCYFKPQSRLLQLALCNADSSSFEIIFKRTLITNNAPKTPHLLKDETRHIHSPISQRFLFLFPIRLLTFLLFQLPLHLLLRLFQLFLTPLLLLLLLQLPPVPLRQLGSSELKPQTWWLVSVIVSFPKPLWLQHANIYKFHIKKTIIGWLQRTATKPAGLTAAPQSPVALPIFASRLLAPESQLLLSKLHPTRSLLCHSTSCSTSWTHLGTRQLPGRLGSNMLQWPSVSLILIYLTYSWLLTWLWSQLNGNSKDLINDVGCLAI